MRGKVNGRFAPGRGEPEVKEDDSSRWLGTYGDAVTLLMAFFVMLYAMSEVDAQKFEAFVSGLEGPFGNTAITQSVLPTNAGLVGPATPPTPVQLVPQDTTEIVPDLVSDDTDATDPGEEALPDTGPEGTATQLTPVQRSQLVEIERALEQAFADVGIDGVADYRIQSRGLVVSIAADDVLFDTGSAQVRAEGRQVVATLADVLTGYPNLVLVEGHTDDVPLQRPGYSNWNLSTDRAVAVVESLIETHGMAGERLGATGYGDTRPRVLNDSPTNRARNRRVDVLVVAQGVQLDG